MFKSQLEQKSLGLQVRQSLSKRARLAHPRLTLRQVTRPSLLSTARSLVRRGGREGDPSRNRRMRLLWTTPKINLLREINLRRKIKLQRRREAASHVPLSRKEKSAAPSHKRTSSTEKKAKAMSSSLAGKTSLSISDLCRS